jgi:hypothetical protein
MGLAKCLRPSFRLMASTKPAWFSAHAEVEVDRDESGCVRVLCVRIEPTAMIARERQALNFIADALSREDPDLVSSLLMFSRLNADEDMPTAEQMRWRGLWCARSSRLSRHVGAATLGGRARRRTGRVNSTVAPMILVGSMLIAVALACVLIALAGVGSGAGSGHCEATPLAGCVRSAQSASPAAHGNS